jgi:amidohydrolase
MITPESIRAVVAEVLPTVVGLRREFHQHPELARQEHQTTARIVDLLTEAGLQPRLRSPLTGLSVELGTGERCVGYRSDLDALPIQEPEGLEFRSQVAGVMHACGHDAHSAIGTGVALALSRLAQSVGPLPGRVRLIFQPAEESFPGGGDDLVREGVTVGLTSIIAFHADPTLEPGMVAMRPGPITASADRFHIILEGPGGHTARPHRSVDLIYAAGRIATELPALIDRLTDARLPKSVVFGQISGGTADNVIPTEVRMSGTCRTLDRSIWEEMPALIDRLVPEITAPTGAKAQVQYVRGIPPVINDGRVVATCRTAVTNLLGARFLTEAPTSMGAEDFASYTEVVPGNLIRLGVKPPGLPIDLHSAAFKVDEAALETGLLVGLACLLELLL